MRWKCDTTNMPTRLAQIPLFENVFVIVCSRCCGSVSGCAFIVLCKRYATNCEIINQRTCRLQQNRHHHTTLFLFVSAISYGPSSTAGGGTSMPHPRLYLDGPRPNYPNSSPSYLGMCSCIYTTWQNNTLSPWHVPPPFTPHEKICSSF